MLEKFKKFEIQNSGVIFGGVKGGVLNAAIGKSNVASQSAVGGGGIVNLATGKNSASS